MANTTDLSGSSLTTGASSPPQSTSPSSPLSPPSETEAKYYYYGLPSRPTLVARTGTTPWEAPTSPEAYPTAKELRPVGNHAIVDVWDGGLAARSSPS